MSSCFDGLCNPPHCLTGSTPGLQQCTLDVYGCNTLLSILDGGSLCTAQGWDTVNRYYHNQEVCPDTLTYHCYHDKDMHHGHILLL